MPMRHRKLRGVAPGLGVQVRVERRRENPAACRVIRTAKNSALRDQEAADEARVRLPLSLQVGHRERSPGRLRPDTEGCV